MLAFIRGKRLGRVKYIPIKKLYPQKTNNDYLYYSELADEKNKDKEDESKHISIFEYFDKAPIYRILKITRSNLLLIIYIYFYKFM
jgi:hypothetical protein